MCGFILYIFIYISQIFRTASPFLKTEEEKNKQKQNLVLQFTLLKKLKKKHQLHIVQFNISMFVMVLVMRLTALE